MRSALHTGAKILLIGLIAALVIPLAVPVASGQRTADTAIIDLGGDETTPPGATYQLSITGRDLTSLAALGATLHFDQDLFEFRSASVPEGRKGFIFSHNLHVHESKFDCVDRGHNHNTCVPSEESHGGKMELALAGSKGLHGDHDLLTLTFEVVGKNGAAGWFHLEGLEAFAEDERPLNTKARSASGPAYKQVRIHLPRVTHSLPAKGDVNGDGRIRVDDVLRLLRSAVKRITLSRDEQYAADVGPLTDRSCGDGRLSLADAQWILKATTGSADLSPCGDPMAVGGLPEIPSPTVKEILPKGTLDIANMGIGLHETLIRQESIEQEHLDLFGYSLAGVRKDGRDWLIIGSPGESNPEKYGRGVGKIYLLKDPGGPLEGNVIECIQAPPIDCVGKTAEDPNAKTEEWQALGSSVGFGFSVASAKGNIQQGGTVLASTGSSRDHNNNPWVDRGRIYSFKPDQWLNRPTGVWPQLPPVPLSWPSTEYPPNTGMGSAIVTGDFNGDGADDIAVGAPSYPTRDAHLIFGGTFPSRLITSLDGGSSVHDQRAWSGDAKIVISNGFNTDGTMFVTNDGEHHLFKTDDFGVSFDPIPNGQNGVNTKVSAIALSREYPSDRVALVGSTDPNSPGILRTSDGGETWLKANNGLSAGDRNITALATARHGDAKTGRAFLATDKGTIASSDDNGKTWKINPTNLIGHSYVDSLVNDIEPMPNYGVSPVLGKDSNDDCIQCLQGYGVWLGMDYGIAVSMDGAWTWPVLMNMGKVVLDVAIAPTPNYDNNWVVFLGTTDGLYRTTLSRNATASEIINTTWTPSPWLSGTSVHEIVISSLFKHDGTAFATTDDGVYKTTNGNSLNPSWTLLGVHNLGGSLAASATGPPKAVGIALAQRTAAGAVNIVTGGSQWYEGADQQIFDLQPNGSEIIPWATYDLAKTHPFTGRKGDRFGHALAAGDFNCDGFDDLAVGNPYEDYQGVDSGVVFVMQGSSNGLAQPSSFIQQSVPSAHAGALFGYALASGNFNGDKCDDLVVGAPRANGTGRVEIFLGSKTGLQADSVEDNGAHKQDDALFGFALATGDMDGDGNDDLAVGAPFFDSKTITFLDPSNMKSGGVKTDKNKDSGLVRIYITEPGSTWAVKKRIPSETAKPNEMPLAQAISAYDRYGYSLAFADLDDDGRDELAAGAPFKALPGGPAVQKHPFLSGALGDLEIRPGEPGLATDGGAVFLLDLTSEALAVALPKVGVERPTAPITKNVVAFIYRRADSEKPDLFAYGWHLSTGSEPTPFLTEEWEALFEDTVNWDQLEVNHHRIEYKFHFINSILDDPLTWQDTWNRCREQTSHKNQVRGCEFEHLLEELDQNGLLPPLDDVKNDDGWIRVFAHGSIVGGPPLIVSMKKPSSWANSNQNLYMASDTYIADYNIRFALERSATHELGHVLDRFPDHYNSPYLGAAPYDSQGGTKMWDRMSVGNNRHHLGWYNWVNYFTGPDSHGNIESLDLPPGAGTPQPSGYVRSTHVLAPAASFSPGPLQLLNIHCPTPPGKDHLSPRKNVLSVEFRTRIGADETLPDEGVLISKVYHAPEAPGAIGDDGLAWVIPQDKNLHIGSVGPDFEAGTGHIENDATFSWDVIQGFYSNIDPVLTAKYGDDIPWELPFPGIFFSTPDNDVRIYARPDRDPSTLLPTGNVIITVDRRTPSPNAAPEDTCWGYLKNYMTADQLDTWQNNWG